MMYTILSKMVSGLTTSPSLSHTSQPADSPQRQNSLGHGGPLLACFRGVHHSGCVDAEAVHQLDSLLTAAGPVCYVDQLVHVSF